MTLPRPWPGKPSIPQSVEVGARYGKLTMLAPAEALHGCRAVLCRCDCGREKVLRLSHVISGHSKSCGCLAGDIMRKTHGMTESRTFVSWISMLNRCHNENTPAFKKYGARGITVCARWRESFENFLADMGERPEETSLDRIDNERGYEPDNCRWATRLQQGRNRRSVVLLTHDGETKCIAEWAEQLGLRAEAISSRLRRGWSTYDALTTPAVLGANQQRRGSAASRDAA